MPKAIRASYERLDNKGAYMLGEFVVLISIHARKIPHDSILMYKLDNGDDLFFWLGNKVDPNFLQQVFGTSDKNEIDIQMVSLRY
jgi:hypothetical protein